MPKVDLFEFSDLLYHAESMGYEWNKAHDLLDNIYPRYGVMTVYIEEVEELLPEEGQDICFSFMDANNLHEFKISTKSC